VPVAFWMVSTAWLTAMFASVMQSRSSPIACSFPYERRPQCGIEAHPQLRINAAEMATTTAAMVAASGSRKRRPLSRQLCRWL